MVPFLKMVPHIITLEERTFMNFKPWRPNIISHFRSMIETKKRFERSLGKGIRRESERKSKKNRQNSPKKKRVSVKKQGSRKKVKT
jgi:hypothetical protein